ncbi:hypothetical protein GSI_08850 [Ganoderma sinense ZZ0214-1]|uniref:Uncharacterized protein n=1 Tax=Ganoderma sinense ZZ0214-1 TaxID=1077348 RepID=A0A2G8S4V1_9APHY|nr:hypothetical protein GSI_08850 [Ganoderma sinense ZZ0214-1]
MPNLISCFSPPAYSPHVSPPPRHFANSEIAELMAVKSKFGAGGEFNPEWMPKHEDLPPALPAPPPEPSVIDDGAPARPAWRTVHRREERRAKAKAKALPAPAPPPAIAAPPGPSNLPAWAQWKPNPLLSPAPMMGTSAAPLPVDIPMPRSGLFGPPTPPPQ